MKFFKIRNRFSKGFIGRDEHRQSLRSVASNKSLVIQLVRGAYNIDLTKVDDSFTKLHRACFFKYDLAKIRKYLKQGYNPNLLDNVTRSSSLHLATVNGDLETIKVLLENGANRNLQDGDGKTPIVKAIECNNQNVIQFFVFSGINPNIQDYQFANSPLHWSIYEKNSQAAKLLLEYCQTIDVNLTNHNQDTPLHLAVKSVEFNDLVASLIEHGAKIDAKNCNSLTPLMIAISFNNLEAVKILRSKNANVYLKDSEGKSCLEIAQKMNNPLIINFLLDTNSSQLSKTNVNNGNNLLIDSWPASEDDEFENNHFKSFYKNNSLKWGKESIERYKNLVNQPICTTDIDLDSISASDIDEDKNGVNDSNQMFGFNGKLSDSLIQFSSPTHNSFGLEFETVIKPENKIQNMSETSTNLAITNDKFIEEIKILLDQEIKDNDEIDALLFCSKLESTQKSPQNSIDNNDFKRSEHVNLNPSKLEKIKENVVSQLWDDSIQVDQQNLTLNFQKNSNVDYLNTATATWFMDENSTNSNEDGEQMTNLSQDSASNNVPSKGSRLSSLGKAKSSNDLEVTKNIDIQIQTDSTLFNDNNNNSNNFSNSNINHNINLNHFSSLICKSPAREAKVVYLEKELKEQSTIPLNEIENLNQEIVPLKSKINSNYEKLDEAKDKLMEEKNSLNNENKKFIEKLEMKKLSCIKEIDQDLGEVETSSLSSKINSDDFIQKLHNLNDECNLLRRELSNEKASLRIEIGQLAKEKEIFSNENKWLKDKLDQLKKEMNQKLAIKDETISYQEQELRNEFKVSIKSMDDLVKRFDEKISSLDLKEQKDLIEKLFLEVNRNQISHQILSMFEAIRKLLENLQLDLVTFFDSIQNQLKKESLLQNDQTQNIVSKNENETQFKTNRYSLFESPMSKLFSSLENLEDNIESQELNMMIKTREKYWTSFSPNLLNLNQIKPQSVFVQSLIKLQALNQENFYQLENNRQKCNLLFNYSKLSNFYFAKQNLQKEITNLRKELGLTLLDITTKS